MRAAGAQAIFMKDKKKSKKIIEEVVENCASANDCTGAYQVVSLEPETVAKYHKEFNKDK